MPFESIQKWERKKIDSSINNNSFDLQTQNSFNDPRLIKFNGDDDDDDDVQSLKLFCK